MTAEFSIMFRDFHRPELLGRVRVRVNGQRVERRSRVTYTKHTATAKDLEHYARLVAALDLPEPRVGPASVPAGTKPAATTERKPCRSCGDKVPLHRWLGLRWIGTPWPKRWTFDLVAPDIAALCLKYTPAPGCGCLYWLKTKWARLTEPV